MPEPPLVTALGLLAAALTTFAFLPQAVKTWRSKSVGDLSLVTYGMFLAGVMLWLAYGLLITNWPLILSNAVAMTLQGAIVGQIVVVRWRERRRAD
ncbi:MAG: SemiSWEET transporter [Bacteroidota bacterium]